MNGRPTDTRWLVGGGVLLILVGYIALWVAPTTTRLLAGPGRLAFYGGLALLVTGVVIWVRQPPRPDPTEIEEDDALPDDFQ